jgi:hypothetical protein
MQPDAYNQGLSLLRLPWCKQSQTSEDYVYLDLELGWTDLRGCLLPTLACHLFGGLDFNLVIRSKISSAQTWANDHFFPTIAF